MTSTRSALEADWLGLCRRAVAELGEMLAGVPTTEQRAIETGTRGSGGDRTLVIDRDAEEVVLSKLQSLHEAGEAIAVIEQAVREQGILSGTLTLGTDGMS